MEHQHQIIGDCYAETRDIYVSTEFWWTKETPVSAHNVRDTCKCTMDDRYSININNTVSRHAETEISLPVLNFW